MAVENQAPAASLRGDSSPTGDDGAEPLPALARLPEEESPYDGASADEPVLWLRLVDPAQRPHAGLAVELSGPGGRHSALSAADGTVWLDGCEPGAYTLAAGALGDRTTAVHTLFTSDLAHDKQPYLVIL